MNFLRNTWYAYAWSEEVGVTPFSRTLLNEPIVAYRKDDGVAVALGDRCPHRFAPLSLGKLCGNTIQCPYHGLRYDERGQCVYNPHGDKKIPAAAKVKSYSLVEKDSLLWVWLGDADKADAALIPDFSFLNYPDKFAYTPGHVTPMSVSYELITDNLMDLTHAAYLHENTLGSEAVSRGTVTVTQTGNTVLSQNFYPNGKPAFVFVATGAAAADDMVDYFVDVRWDPPGCMYFFAGITPTGHSPDEGKLLCSAQLLSPETEHSTHYFWRQYRNFNLEVLGLTEAIDQAIEQAFAREDEPMIKAVQQRMGDQDLWALKPVLLTTDGGAIRVRRLLAKLTEDEARERVGASPVQEVAAVLSETTSSQA